MTTGAEPELLTRFGIDGMIVEQATAWRRHLHRHPELLYDLDKTATFVADLLRQFGCDRVETGIGRSGVVAVIRGSTDTQRRTVALRADMDALPLDEASDHRHRSVVSGRMHACGHDGHTAMLLGAAKHLATARRFDGTAVMVFQPAEEGGKGAEAMINDGLMEDFAIDEVYALHNMPGIPVGHFAIKPGPILAGSDRFRLEILGRGGHAARPHECVDPVLVAAHVVTALQSIVSRSVDPLDSAVLTIGALRAGDTFNVIPQSATLLGTVRTLDERNRRACSVRMVELAESLCRAFGATARVDYQSGHPVTANHEAQTEFIAETAAEVSGPAALDMTIAPLMGSEDFGFMLQRRPGAYIFLGNGETRPLHHPAYDFCDDAIPYGIGLWVRMIERRLPVLAG